MDKPHECKVKEQKYIYAPSEDGIPQIIQTIGVCECGKEIFRYIYPRRVVNARKKYEQEKEARAIRAQLDRGYE